MPRTPTSQDPNPAGPRSGPTQSSTTSGHWPPQFRGDSENSERTRYGCPTCYRRLVRQTLGRVGGGEDRGQQNQCSVFDRRDRLRRHGAARALSRAHRPARVRARAGSRRSRCAGAHAADAAGPVRSRKPIRGPRRRGPRRRHARRALAWPADSIGSRGRSARSCTARRRCRSSSSCRPPARSTSTARGACSSSPSAARPAVACGASPTSPPPSSPANTTAASARTSSTSASAFATATSSPSSRRSA